MAHPTHPHIHDVAPDDIDVAIIRDQQLAVIINGAGGALTAGVIYVAGDTDRERIENLLGIAARLRGAALDLSASTHPSRRNLRPVPSVTS